MNDVTVIFPHQLFAKHPAVEKGRPIYLAEDPLFFGDDKHYPVAFHKQKLVLHRASMNAYADDLRKAGHTVKTIPHTRTFQQELPKKLIGLHLAEPHDFILEKRLRSFKGHRPPHPPDSRFPLSAGVSRRTYRPSEKAVHGILLSGAAEAYGNPHR